MGRELETITHGRERQRPGMDANKAEADVLSYDMDEYDQPKNVTLNGAPLIAVQDIEVRAAEREFSEVTIRLKGTYVSVNATPKESSAQDS